MSTKKRTYPDAGVILAVLRSEPDAGVRAYDILNDPDREFATSSVLALELLPSAIYYQRKDEQEFCETFLKSSVYYAELSESLFDEALARPVNTELALSM